MSDLVCQVCKEAVPTGWMRSGDPDAWYLQNVAPNAASGGTMRPIHVRCASRSIDCPTCAGSGHVQDAQLVMSNWHNRAHAAESALAAALAARIAALEEARRVLEEVVRVAETSYAEAIEIARIALAEPGKPDEYAPLVMQQTD